MFVLFNSCETPNSQYHHGYGQLPHSSSMSKADRKHLSQSFEDDRWEMPERFNNPMRQGNLNGAIGNLMEGPTGGGRLCQLELGDNDDLYQRIATSSSPWVNQCLLPYSSNIKRQRSHPCYGKSRGASKSPRVSGYGCAAGFKRIMKDAGLLPNVPSGNGVDMIKVLPKQGWKCIKPGDPEFPAASSRSNWGNIPSGYALVYKTTRHPYGHVEFKVPKGTFKDCKDCQFVSDFYSKTPYHANSSKNSMIGLCKPPEGA